MSLYSAPVGVATALAPSHGVAKAVAESLGVVNIKGVTFNVSCRADTDVLRLLQCALTPTVQIRTHLSVAEKAEWSIDRSNQMKSVQFK